MGRVKSDNRYLGILTGHDVRRVHTKGNITITRRSGEPFVLHRLIINTSTASAITLTDSGDTTHAQEVIANLKASIAEGDINYSLPLWGNLVVDNPGGSDLTIVYSND